MVQVGVADKCGIDVSLLFRVSEVVEVVLAVDSFRARDTKIYTLHAGALVD